MKELCAQDEKLINEMVDLVKSFYASKRAEVTKRITLKEKENSIITLILTMDKEKIRFKVVANPKEVDFEYHLSTKLAYSIGEAIDYIPKLRWVEYE